MTWIVVEGLYSFQDQFMIEEVTKETAQRYYYRQSYGTGRFREEFVPKKRVVAVFETEEMATVAVNRWVLEFADAIAEAVQERKNLSEKLTGMGFVIADLKRKRREAIARTGKSE